MIDKSIPYCNIIMRMDEPREYESKLPEGFYLDGYKDGDDVAWGEMECAVGDFQSTEVAVDYFRRRYVANPEMLRERFVMVRNAGGLAVSSCIAWHDVRNGIEIPALEWLVTRDGYDGLGLARAAAAWTSSMFFKLKEKPVYLHTQPWSYKAIWLYHEYGFKLASADSFKNYTNQFEMAVPILKSIMKPDRFAAVMSDVVTDIVSD